MGPNDVWVVFQVSNYKHNKRHYSHPEDITVELCDMDTTVRLFC